MSNTKVNISRKPRTQPIKIFHSWTYVFTGAVPSNAAELYTDGSEVVLLDDLEYEVVSDCVAKDSHPSGYNWIKMKAKGDATTRLDALELVSESFHGISDQVTKPGAIYSSFNGWLGEWTHQSIDTYTITGAPFPGSLGLPYDLKTTSGPHDDILSEVAPVKEFRHRALEDFSARLVDEATFSGGIFFADLHKTIAALKRPADGLFTEVIRMAKELDRQELMQLVRYSTQNVKGRKEAIRKASKIYLEAAYGWKPLLSDIADANDTIHLYLKDKKVNEKSSHMRRSELIDLRLREETIYTPVDAFMVKFMSDVSIDASLNYSAAIRHQYQDGLALHLSRLGLLPGNIPGTLWDATRFSFVIDYFVKINNIVSYKPDAKSRIRFCALTTRDVVKNSTTFNLFKSTTDPMNPYAFASSGWLNRDVKCVHRKTDEKVGGLIVPHFRVPKPLQALNLAVLATNLRLR